MIWNRSKECISRDELADLQGKRLVKLVKYMYENAGYYNKKMKKLGIEPGDIRGIEDLVKLPFTTKEDLMEAYPQGVFAVQNRKIIRYHTSENILGVETAAGYTRNDINACKECVARSVSMANLGKKDIIHVVYNYGVHVDGLGAEKTGAAVIPVFGFKPVTLITSMRKMRVTGIISTPSYLMRLAQLAEKQGLKNELWLKSAICGGEPWTEGDRKKIQDRLGIKVYDIFGLDELTGLGVACECEYQDGMHIQEDYFLAEIVDMRTLVVLPGGIRGELVFTTLQKEGIPLIRYRTRNITKINYEICECGRTMARFDRICDGMSDVLFIRGNSVSSFQIEAALSKLQDIEASYIVCIRREHNLDVVDIYIEGSLINGELLSDGREEVKRRVANAVGSVIGIMPHVYYAASQSARFVTGASAGISGGRKVTVVDERRH